MYWKLERTLADDKKELTAATLRSIALNYIECKSPKPPKPLQRAIKQLKQLDNIVVTKPDKGTGVVVMNKSDNVNLLSQASINDTSKFPPVSLQRPEDERPTIKTLPPPFAEGAAPRVCCLEYSAKGDCRFCLPGGLTSCPSLWSPKDTKTEAINEINLICYGYLQLFPRQVAR